MGSIGLLVRYERQSEARERWAQYILETNYLTDKVFYAANRHSHRKNFAFFPQFFKHLIETKRGQTPPPQNPKNFAGPFEDFAGPLVNF